MEIAHTIVDAVADKKGEAIILLDIHSIAVFADYFVICSGISDRMLDTLADAAIARVKQRYEISGRLEGLPRDGWLLVDFGDVILHVFSPDRRQYYKLEELWRDGKTLLHLQ